MRNRNNKKIFVYHMQISLQGKEIIMDNEKNNENDADRIIALALMEHLYNEGKISELVYRNIKIETINKISVENRGLIC